MITLFGISNCDTVKRARQALEAAGIEHRFHDFRKDGLTAETVRRWLSKLDRDELINQKGTTWRKLSAEERDIESDEGAIRLMLEQPSLIKRPVFQKSGQLRVGFARKDEQAMLDWLQS